MVPSFHDAEDINKLAMELNGATRLRIQNFHPSKSILDPTLQAIKPFPDHDIASLQQSVDKLISM